MVSSKVKKIIAIGAIAATGLFVVSTLGKGEGDRMRAGGSIQYYPQPLYSGAGAGTGTGTGTMPSISFGGIALPTSGFPTATSYDEFIRATTNGTAPTEAFTPKKAAAMYGGLYGTPSSQWTSGTAAKEAAATYGGIAGTAKKDWQPLGIGTTPTTIARQPVLTVEEYEKINPPNWRTKKEANT